MLKRNLLIALMGALVVHIAYFSVQLCISIVKTFFYQPQFALSDVALQSEVSFGFVMHDASLILSLSYFIVASLLFAALHTKQWMKRKV